MKIKVLSEISLKAVLDHSLKTTKLFMLKGHPTGVSVHRLRQFAIHGCKCQFCGIEGNTVLITKDGGGGIHADVYHVDKVSGKRVLMTRDHIRPASKRGDNTIWNMRPLCSRCNSTRGNAVTEGDVSQWRFNRKWASIYNKIFKKKKKSFKIASRILNQFSPSRQYQIAKFITRLVFLFQNKKDSNHRSLFEER